MEALMMMALMLVGVHWILDYPLQGDFLANAKFNGPLRFYHLVAHAGIQGTGVAVVFFVFIGPQAVWFGLSEWLAHIVIDELKVRGKTTFAVDQALHVICKALWLAIVFAA
ncbi:DUF3307 domain-containing protein [Agrobacterium sp. Ap1]|uniref:DUF3307 domain-containing protein n=1 Tax=Agrobacterium sp. Ap1 TaxID=2815337 RepID=UPI001A907CE3|nr:DUF3307 domain-containing protein [Agrobacterium sp. Ap1]MBO0141490.1 DUF3307 domain-containing protein [Agrobacterium sp. Ap1]